jgi:hypothetical protein
MQILYENKVRSLTLAYSTQTYLYEAENVVTTNTLQGWRSTTDGASYLLFDAGSGNTITADCIGFKNHNLNSDAVIKIQGNATDVWTSPSVDVTLTWRDAQTIFETFTGGAYRYWRFYVDNSASGTDGYIEIGTLYIGSVLDMPSMTPTISMDWNNNSLVEFSTSNNAFGDIRKAWLEYTIEFPTIINTKRKELIAALNLVQNVTPLFIAIFDDDKDFEEPFYGTITSTNLSFKKDRGRLFQSSFSWREVD